MIRVIVFSVTFHNISVISVWTVLLVKEAGVPEANHPPVASHWQTFSHNVVSSMELTTFVVIDTDCTDSCKSNYHTMTNMMALI